MNEELTTLLASLDLSLAKKNKSSSVAYSTNGKSYVSGMVDSDTHLITMTSEQSAVAIASISTDYFINKVVTMHDTDEETINISPLIIKFLIDHSIRSGVDIAYNVYNKNGKELFTTKNVKDCFIFYKPENKILQKTIGSAPTSNKITLDTGVDIVKTLKTYASQAVLRNFPTSDSASGYGTAIITKNNTLYFGGQYSSFDHRLALHSEMATIISALMDNNSEITHLGIISTKHTDIPCNCCGICRQFIAEISAKKNLNIEIYCFALENDQFTKNTITSYLPDQWTNLK